MSVFKRMVSNDTDHVIFNLDELADLHEVDGRQVPVIIDDVKLEEMKANPKYAGGYNTATSLPVSSSPSFHFALNAGTS